MNEAKRYVGGIAGQVGQAFENKAAPNYSYERQRFEETIQAIFSDCIDLIVKKNSDYTKLNPADPFFNFRQGSVDKFLRNENINKVDGMSFGICVRLNDKRRRRENLLFTGEREVYSETLADTIKDEINYLAILLTHLLMHGYNKDLEKTESQIDTRPVLTTDELTYIAKENARLTKQYNDVMALNSTLINERAEVLTEMSELRNSIKENAKSKRSSIKRTKKL